MFGGFCADNGKTVGGTLGALLKIGGLTFYKDYSKGGSLNADYSVGSPVATYTNGTTNVPTFSGGVSMTSAGVDVLKYQILGNRTAAQETIVIKFSPDTDFANDGVERALTYMDSNDRRLDKSTTGTKVRFFPNSTASGGTTLNSTTTPLSGVTYVIVARCVNSPSTYQIFLNGSSDSSEGSTAWTLNSLGTYFYLGCDGTNSRQLNGVIKSVSFFNRSLSTGEILALNNLM